MPTGGHKASKWNLFNSLFLDSLDLMVDRSMKETHVSLVHLMVIADANR